MKAAKVIFLIEDNPVTTALLCRSLRKNENYTVFSFDKAEDALAPILHQFPDVLIIDHQLPGMSGIELFEKIKPVLPSSTLVIMASAIEDGNMVLQFIQKGIRNFLIKDENMLESLKEILRDEL